MASLTGWLVAWWPLLLAIGVVACLAAVVGFALWLEAYTRRYEAVRGDWPRRRRGLRRRRDAVLVGVTELCDRRAHARLWRLWTRHEKP